MINQYPLMATSHTFNLYTNYQFSKQHSTYTMSWTVDTLIPTFAINSIYVLIIHRNLRLYHLNWWSVHHKIAPSQRSNFQVYSCVLFSELHDRSNCQIFIRAVIVSRTIAHKSTSSSCGEKFCFSKNCNNSHWSVFGMGCKYGLCNPVCNIIYVEHTSWSTGSVPQLSYCS